MKKTKKKVIKEHLGENTAIGKNAAYLLTTGHHNIIIGDNIQVAEDEAYMLAIGGFRYQMTPEEYEKVNAGVQFNRLCKDDAEVTIIN